MASLHAPRRTRRWVPRPLPSQAGLTIVETMVAMMLLLVGVLGTVSLIDVSNTSAANSRARDGATNLARELLEDAHDTSYGQVAASSTWLNPTLQGLSGGSGSVTNPDSHSAQTSVSRRGYSYTAAVSWCAVDDSKDGYGTHLAAVTWCSDSATTGTADSLPQDLKRITATITYSQGGTSRTLSETITMSATGGVVVPAATQLVPFNPSLTGPPYTITDNTQTSEVFRATAAGAADMKFSVNGVEVTSGVTNNGNGTWDYNWQIAGLVDGTYTIGATSIDALGNRGQQITLQVRLARGAPLTAQHLVGGYNYVNPTGVGNGGSLVTELAWDANPEGSVTGYEVLRGATSVCGGQTNLTTSCLDAAPPSSGSTTYTVKTWYRDANDALQSVSTTYPVTAPGVGSLPTTYGLVTSRLNNWAGTNCDTSSIYEQDLVPNYPTTGGTATTFSQVSVAACMAKFTSTTTLTAGNAVGKFWFTNSSTTKDCTSANAYVYVNNANNTFTLLKGPIALSPSINRNTGTPVQRTWTAALSAHTFNPGDQLFWFQNVTGQTGCASVLLWYNAAAYQPTVTFPALNGGGTALSTPNAVGGLTVTANGDGTRTLNWTAPTSSSTVPAPDFYRIYRDGTAIANRVDTADAVNTSVSTASSAGATTLTVAGVTGYQAGQTLLVDTGANQDTVTVSSVNTATNTLTFSSGMTHAHAVGVAVVLQAVNWLDTNTGGTSHTYRVSAVSANLAESPFAPTAGVTG